MGRGPKCARIIRAVAHAGDPTDSDDLTLFPLTPVTAAPEALLAPLQARVWTEKKAQLIQRYLKYFVLVTRHGTYIDAFAGPQYTTQMESWAARLAIEFAPRWLRQFHLFEADAEKVKLIKSMVSEQPPRTKKEPKREIYIHAGDANVLIGRLLAEGKLPRRAATFCLLDQRTFECRWSTCRALAAYRSGPKFELFYFLAQAWLDRALAETKDTARIDEWWGGSDWSCLRDARGVERAKLVADRFRAELGYWAATPYPIYQRPSGGRTMYYMIHATDHPAAPGLMRRAYERTVSVPLEEDQLPLTLFGEAD